ncbi:MAG: JAB domain-containing protein [Lachnospiraceae bacterium]|nr:JAB domain-containing protein [Lachnospiraceae bacterium]
MDKTPNKGSKKYSIPTIKLSYVSDGIAIKPRCDSPSITAQYIRDSYEEGEIGYRERFNVVYLNRANKMIGINTVSIGGTDSTVVDRKIIFAGALLANATSIIISHNHPSGNTLPSIQDDKLTRDIKLGCETLGLNLLDHIILTDTDYYSYRNEGKL